MVIMSPTRQARLKEACLASPQEALAANQPHPIIFFDVLKSPFLCSLPSSYESSGIAGKMRKSYDDEKVVF